MKKSVRKIPVYKSSEYEEYLGDVYFSYEIIVSKKIIKEACRQYMMFKDKPLLTKIEKDLGFLEGTIRSGLFAHNLNQKRVIYIIY